MMVTQSCNAKGSHVYNPGSCLAVLFLQGRHRPDLILVALAGRVGNVVRVVGLLRPRTRRGLLYMDQLPR